MYITADPLITYEAVLRTAMKDKANQDAHWTM